MGKLKKNTCQHCTSIAPPGLVEGVPAHGRGAELDDV